MKVGSKELFEVVRQVVREEVRKVLPALVARHLSEAYIKKALTEANGAGTPTANRQMPRQEYRLPGNLRELIQGNDEEDEEGTPQIQPNDHQGIYEPSNPMVKHKSESVAKLLSRDNPMANIYEGLQPIEAEGSTAGMPSVPLKQVAQATGMDFSKMNALVEGLEGDARRKAKLSDRDVERDLERKRKLLEIPVRS